MFEQSDEKLNFHPVSDPTEEEMSKVIAKIASRVTKLFVRQGLMDEDHEEISTEELISATSVRGLSLIEGLKPLSREKSVKANPTVTSRLCVAHLG